VFALYVKVPIRKCVLKEMFDVTVECDWWV